MAYTFTCPKHGPDCTFDLKRHPLPPQGREATRKGRWADAMEDPEADDPTGYMADREAARSMDR